MTERARLRPGDRVAVVAPSGPVPAPDLDAGRAVLEAAGLEVVTGPHVLDRTGYLAGTDADRAADLTAAWCDPAVRAVVCARGGYGATRLLPLLDWDALAAAVTSGGAPVLHGSSDVTALHAAFAHRLAVPTSFGPNLTAGVLARDRPDPASAAGLVAALAGEAGAVTGTATWRPGTVRGPVAGGNLAMLAATTGTPYAAPPAAGSIALLEDVREAPYRVDRLLTQLLQAGWFDAVAGVALGSWTGCGDAVADTLAERLLPLGVPVLAGIDVGHGPVQLTVPLGVDVELDASARTLRWGPAR